MIAYFPRFLPINWQKNGADTKYTKAKWNHQSYYYQVKLPCGYCLDCRLAKARDWAVRCCCEAKLWSNNCFVTLTYNDKNLPLTKRGQKTLVVKHMQDFFKRLLKSENRGSDDKIRRFYCGEYGAKGGRPHYHAIIFNYTPKDLKYFKEGKNGDIVYKSKKLQEIWGKGFVTVGNVTAKSAGYVARYTLKKAGVKPRPTYKIPNRAYHPVHNPKVNKWIKIFQDKDAPMPEFVRSSRRPGIGNLYWELNKIKLKRQEGVYVKDGNDIKIFGLPKAFKEKWKNENPEEYYRFAYQQEVKTEKRKQELLAQNPGFTWQELEERRIATLHKRCKSLRREEGFDLGINLEKT